MVKLEEKKQTQQKKAKKQSKNKAQRQQQEDDAAWHDADDDNLRVDIATSSRLRKLRKSEKEQVISGTEYTQRLRDQFSKIGGGSGAAWATLPSDQPLSSSTTTESDDENDDTNLLSERKKGDSSVSKPADSDVSEAIAAVEKLTRSNQSLGGRDTLASGGGLNSSNSKLAPGMIRVTRMKDANAAEPAKAVIESVEFHPNGQLLMTASLDKTLRFFQIDGTRNPKIQSVHLSDLPIFRAAFASEGTQVIATGRRKYYYSLDLGSGQVLRVPGIQGRSDKSLESFAVSRDGAQLAFMMKDGYISMVNSSTKKWLFDLKMNGQAREGAYSADGQYFYSNSDEGQVYLWDLRTRRCLSQVTDEGTIHATGFALSPDEKYYATGSDTGVVNVYRGRGGDFVTDSTSLPSSPLKSLMHLTTPVDCLTFNHDSQLMLMTSRKEKDSARLVHLPSLTVFNNWPTVKTPLHYVTSTAFSPQSGYMAMGNDRGVVLLYRLNHFTHT